METHLPEGMLWVLFWIVVPGLVWGGSYRRRSRRDGEDSGQKDGAASDGRRTQRRASARLGVGIALIGFGALLAFDQWRTGSLHHLSSHWPLLLLIPALIAMIERSWLHIGAHFTVLAAVGLELHQLGHDAILQSWWPLGIVWIGLVLTLRSLLPRDNAACGWHHE
ncbi:MAG TPA: hypothetical protein VNV60_10240 [Holophagaceae bacterium]|jgi:hypothetical protein|nr:hypothetical protein [Holophagaceae bacterium]